MERKAPSGRHFCDAETPGLNFELKREQASMMGGLWKRFCKVVQCENAPKAKNSSFGLMRRLNLKGLRGAGWLFWSQYKKYEYSIAGKWKKIKCLPPIFVENNRREGWPRINADECE